MEKNLFNPLIDSNKLNRSISILLIMIILISTFFSFDISHVNAANLLLANFDSNTNGFSYVDDTFGTSQPNYASGSRVTGTNCYGSSGGCLNVRLGGVDANTINNMSGGWRYTFNLASDESGVSVSLRYRLVMPAVYDYDDFSRVLVSIDGVVYGRGSRSYVDHTGGDNNFAHDTGWLQVDLYVGDLAAGSHNLVIGGYSNKKNVSTEITNIYVDTVALTSSNDAPIPSAAQVLVENLDLETYKSDIQTLASFGDRCRMTSTYGTNCVAPYTSYFSAQNWLANQLTAMGYTVQYNTYTTSLPGTTGSNLYATKIGSVHPESMYIVSNMFDGRGGGGAADDDASGIALTLEIARVLASPDVQTDYSVRFLFFDEEESGLKGSQAYVSTRQALRGIENPPGSGLYPEPNWLGIIQHDMVLYDHGVGTRTTNQSPYADLDVEWTAGATFANQSMALAQTWRFLNGKYANTYPANSADKSQSTDDYSFRNYCPAVSVRENRRSLSGEWINPYYHNSGDIYSNYSEADFLLGFNATQTTLGVVAELAGTHLTSSNQAPVATPQSVTTNEDIPLGITLAGSDPEEDALNYTILSSPQYGTLTGTTPALTYIPTANFNGSDSFTYKVNDGYLDSAPATVSIGVNPVNDAPIAFPQNTGTVVDVPLQVTLSGSDLDADPLSFLVTSQPVNGTLQGESPTFTYTPATGFVGTDSFTFVASDGLVQSEPVLIEITISNINHAPSADPQSLSTEEDTALAIVLSGLDADGDLLSFTIQTYPTHGSLEGISETLVYVPNADYFGQDSFTFVANDGQVNSQAALVEIDVLPVLDAPVANSAALSLNEDGSIDFTLTGTDADGDDLNFFLLTAPLQGTLTGIPPQLTYTPAADYFGSDTLSFIVNDGSLDSAEAFVNFTVLSVNDLPVANPQVAGTNEDTPVGLTLTGWDPEGELLSFAVVSNPAHGSLSGTAPDLTYTPAANFNGTDSFIFKVNDGLDNSISSNVTLTINPVNDPPVASPLSVATQQDAQVAVVLVGSDIENDPLTCAVASSPANGTLTGTGCNLLYTPAAGFTGADSFTYTVNDGQAGSTPAQVSITVNPSGPVTVFWDNFETNLGWVRNPNGTDTATVGVWERGNPETVSYYGYKQLGTTVSGSYDLVTGRLAGSSSGSYDLDGGVTSMRSPLITLPASGELQITFRYYLAHYTNSSTADYLRVKIVGTSTVTILQELGATNDDDASWATFSGSLNTFRGQSIYILIEAADASGASLVEAAIDDVLIVRN